MSADDDDFREPGAPGWDAINEALRPVYGETEPLHWGTVVPYSLGGPDPITGISAYRSDRQTHHLHYVTYGFSELYEKESDDPRVSGFGFELTFRLACRPDDAPPNWVLNFLQNLGRYVFGTGNRFGVGHSLPLNGPICLGRETAIRTVAFALDPQLGWADTPNGQVEFLQVVGLTEDELAAIQCWNAEGFLELVRSRNELLVTDISRESYLNDPEFAAEVRRRTEAEGASAHGLYANEARVTFDDQACRLVLGALLAGDVSRRLLGRIPFGRPFSIYTEGGDDVRFEPGDQLAWRREEGAAVITLTAEQSRRLATLLAPRKAGTYKDTDLPGLTLVVEPTEITDDDGNVTEVLG